VAAGPAGSTSERGGTLRRPARIPGRLTRRAVAVRDRHGSRLSRGQGPSRSTHRCLAMPDPAGPADGRLSAVRVLSAPME